MSSKKGDLKQLYNMAGETIKMYHAEKKKIEDRWDLPEEQKLRGLRELRAQAEYSMNKCRDLALTIIDSVRDDINKDYEEQSIDKLLDPGYQTSVNTVVDGLKRNAFSREDFKKIVERFDKDQFALDKFRDAIPVENMQMRVVIPRDKRVDTLEHMNSLAKDVEHYMRDESLSEDQRILTVKRGIIEKNMLDQYDNDLKLI